VGKHGSEERISKDHYPTPEWVTTLGLLSYIPVGGLHIWEPAAGRGNMARPLMAAGAKVFCSDIHDYGWPLDACHDFTKPLPVLGQQFQGIVTNPPYGKGGKLACEFIERGIEYITRYPAFLALLLSTDFDSGKTRRAYFADCPQFAARVIMTERIVWFKNSDDDHGPKENHCWYIWDARKAPKSCPVTLYGPAQFYQQHSTAAARQQFHEEQACPIAILSLTPKLAAVSVSETPELTSAST
jgi:hypothetical protein